MAFWQKFTFAILLSLIGWSAGYGQEQPALTPGWYKSFFARKKMPAAEKAIAVIDQKIIKAQQSDDNRLEAHLLIESGLLRITQTRDYEQAMEVLIRALSLSDSLNLEKEQIFTKVAIAHIFDQVGNYDKSLDLLDQAMKSNDKTDDTEIHVFLLNELGKTNLAKGNFEVSAGYYEQILADKDGLDPETLAEALFNIAHVFQQERKEAKSLDYYKRALVIYRSKRNRKDEARTLNSIGTLYGSMNNKPKEMANHVAAFDLRQAIGDKNGIAESGNNIGALYIHEKNFKKALPNLMIAMRAARESQDQEKLRRTYELLSQCYAGTKDYKEALENKDLFIAMNDFIEHEKNEQRILETQNQYSLGKKQVQIEKLEVDNRTRQKEIADQKKIQQGLIALVILTGIIIGLGLYLYLNKRKSNVLLSAANEKVNNQNGKLTELNGTKDKFFSIIGHDLKGPLNSLSSFSNLLSNHLESLTQDEIKMLSRDLDKQLKNLFALLENLLEWSRSQTGAIEFIPETFDIALSLQESKELLSGQSTDKKITILGPETSAVMIAAHKHSITTVIRNLISNSIKFTPEGGAIKLDVTAVDGFALVSIADTGVGMSQDIIQRLFRIDTKHSTKGTSNEKGTGLGLILCKEFVEKNHGTIKVTSEPGKGSVFSFTVPLSQNGKETF